MDGSGNSMTVIARAMIAAKAVAAERCVERLWRGPVVTLALLAATALTATGALADDAAKPILLKHGQAVAFAVTMADGKMTFGVPRLGNAGALEPADGEIVITLTLRGKDDYSQLLISEKTAQPVDFLATAYIDKIVIDEREICGRLGAPFQQRIAGNSWKVGLREFAVGTGSCKTE